MAGRGEAPSSEEACGPPRRNPRRPHEGRPLWREVPFGSTSPFSFGFQFGEGDVTDPPELTRETCTVSVRHGPLSGSADAREVVAKLSHQGDIRRFACAAPVPAGQAAAASTTDGAPTAILSPGPER